MSKPTSFESIFQLHQAGKSQEALDAYLEFLKHNPNHVDALVSLATLYLQRGMVNESARYFQLALDCDPQKLLALHNYALCLREQKLYERSLEYFDLALKLDPQFELAYKNKLALLAFLGKSAERVQEMRLALRQIPQSYEIELLLIAALREAKQNLEALTHIDHVLVNQPKREKVHNLRGNVLLDLGRERDAVEAYRAAIALKPDYANAHGNLGIAYLALAEYENALISFDQALRLDSGLVGMKNNRANALQNLHRFDEALRAYDDILEQNPKDWVAAGNKGMLCLLTGRFAEGWFLYEAHWQNSAMSIHGELFSYPLWNGRDSLKGKIIILHPAQGFGDTIQFSRYARLLAKQASKVYLVVNDPLYHLMKHSVAQWPEGQNIEILTAGAQIPAFHFQLPLMTAPGILGTDLSNIPNFGPYLFAENTIAYRWQQSLGEKRRPRVGLVWSGSDKHTNDKNRSIPLSEVIVQFQKHLRCSVEFHSLQKEIKSEDLLLLAKIDISQHTLDLKTFNDTAALIMQMDLVISVDTSVAHLAAALGVATWIALPYVPDFRWLLDRQDSPWYSSMRLFRQTRPREWSNVLEALAEECNLRFSQSATLTKDSHLPLGQMNLANELVELGKWNQAESMYRNEFEISGDSAKLHNNWGVVLQKLRRFDEALHCFDRAIQLDPNYVSPRLNKSMCLLSLGQFDEGWELYEWRWKNAQWDSSKRHFSQPLWNGQKLEHGSTLLIYAEQGLGDTLQFCRLLSLVLERMQADGVSVIFEVPASLVSLLQCLAIPVFARTAALEGMPVFDYQCPLLSVPFALQLQVEDIPQEVPFLRVDSDKQQHWGKTIPSSERLKIGVVWAGSNLHQNDKNRSIPFGHFSPLLQLDADYYVLQKELKVAEKTGLEMMRSFGKRIQLLASKLEDFTDTAAAINNLDLIISVDTSVAHLVGALGKPLYLLLPYEADFRWMHERSDTAWYPSAHLFRQTLPGDWKTVIQEVRTQLAKDIKAGLKKFRN